MNNRDYWKEVKSTATNIIDTATNDYDLDGYDSIEDLINDVMLHETIDGHEWIIYTRHHLDILKHSDNAEYMSDNIGGMEETLKDDGLQGLHQALAFWAFYADVQAAIATQLEEGEEA